MVSMRCAMNSKHWKSKKGDQWRVYMTIDYQMSVAVCWNFKNKIECMIWILRSPSDHPAHARTLPHRVRSWPSLQRCGKVLAEDLKQLETTLQQTTNITIDRSHWQSNFVALPSPRPRSKSLREWVFWIRRSLSFTEVRKIWSYCKNWRRYGQLWSCVCNNNGMQLVTVTRSSEAAWTLYNEHITEFITSWCSKNIIAHADFISIEVSTRKGVDK